MKFIRPVSRDNLNAVVHRAVNGLIFTDGSVSGTEPLPAAYTERSTFELDLSGNGQVFVLVDVSALGGAALTGITVLISFYDPDTGKWFPSKEGASRTGNAAAHEWACNATGQYILASRAEIDSFTKARVQFKASGGAADSATLIRASWRPNSKVAPAWTQS